MTEEEIQRLNSRCRLCPRLCAVNRYEKKGFCREAAQLRAAKAMLHFAEEPLLCEAGGAGAVFFSGCALRCVFCQNYEISAQGFGKEISVRELADIFLSLEQAGAQNIDLVSASHFLPSAIAALDLVKHRLKIPVVYNSSGYESEEALKMLSGYIDIYLPDVKYFDDPLAKKYSSAPGYFDIACRALSEMVRQTGAPCISEKDGAKTMTRGVIVRHMVLPGCKDDSIAVLRGLYERFGNDKFLISLLRQYTPFYKAKTEERYKSLDRRVTGYEYDKVADEAARLGFSGFIQERSSAKEKYTPSFDLEGLP